MTAYATPEQLASALRVQFVAGKNDADLAACTEAATEEIDHWRDAADAPPFADPPPALVNRVCIARSVEWWKANDVAFGALGFDATGVLNVPKDSFARHARDLIPYKVSFGVA